jgi:hypothetical protein
MKIGLEKKIQFNLVNWLRQCHPEIIFMANMNENNGTPMWRQIGQRMGVMPGASDLFFPAGNDYFKGLWIELKTEKGSASEAQMKFIEKMCLLGYAAFITYGYDEAELTVRLFYHLDK